MNIYKTSMRFVTYTLLGIAFGIAVMLRINAVNAERAADKNTFIGDWSTNGKPVKIAEAIKENMIVNEKLTVVTRDGINFNSFVTGETRNKLRVGQSFASVDKKAKFFGKISSIDSNVDLDTGLYEIRFKKDKKSNTFSSLDVMPVLIAVKKYKNVLTLPTRALVNENKLNYVWKIVGDKAERVSVIYIAKNNEKVLVESGVAQGDQIIVSGYKNLKPNEKIQILK